MTVLRGRVIKADAAGAARRLAAHDPDEAPETVAGIPRGVVVAAAVVDARAKAERIVAEAEERAAAIVREAEARARASAADAANAAREDELAKLAAHHLVLRAREEGRAVRELDRTVELAVLLAERVVGEALAVDGTRIAALATEALCEARGARRIRVEAAREDVGVLGEVLTALGHEVAEIVPNEELGRGSILLETELGRVDARLRPQLERLAAALREALASSGEREGGIGGSR